MSKYKEATENIQQLSSEESTEAQVQPSSPSAKTDNTKNSTKTTKKRLQHTVTTEKVRQHALIMRVALLWLEKRGFLKRYKVLSKDGETQEIRIVLSPDVWTTGLDLK